MFVDHTNCKAICRTISIICSPYQIVLNESHGSICQYEGTMIDDFTRLAHMPLQTPGPVYTLSEITNNIRNLSNDLVSFTAAVRMVSACVVL